MYFKAIARNAESPDSIPGQDFFRNEFFKLHIKVEMDYFIYLRCELRILSKLKKK